MKMFWVLMSRWRMCRLWMYLTARQTWRKMKRMRSSLRCLPLCLEMREKRSPPAQYSMTIWTESSQWKDSL